MPSSRCHLVHRLAWSGLVVWSGWLVDLYWLWQAPFRQWGVSVWSVQLVLSGAVSCVGFLAASVVGLLIDIYGEFDSGSGRTLAACLTHASRTEISVLAPGDQWRTGE